MLLLALPAARLPALQSSIDQTIWNLFYSILWNTLKRHHESQVMEFSLYCRNISRYFTIFYIRRSSRIAVHTPRAMGPSCFVNILAESIFRYFVRYWSAYCKWPLSFTALSQVHVIREVWINATVNILWRATIVKKQHCLNKLVNFGSYSPTVCYRVTK